ncbi:MAG: cache domain-containing protein, partial [Selenomonadaceae bacterium]|nr:cache domain-containing protein [Selenomonadaceae bacterium]
MNSSTIKGKILMFVLPIVIIGLIVLSGVIFNYINATFEEQILTTNSSTTKEVGEEVSAWLDKRMLETHLIASITTTRTLNAADMNRNNIYRLQLMKKRYPDVYDSVSWGPFDGSGVLYGETSNGFKEMHNQDKAWYKQTMTGSQDSFMSSPVISQATGKIIVNSIALARNDNGQP